jgi:glycosyltransferase involved in cell wall biosynthesis
MADQLRVVPKPPAPKHVLFVIGSLGAGGAERQMVLLVEGLARVGMRCEVFVLNGSGPLRPRLDAIGVAVHDAGLSGASSKVVGVATLGSAFVRLWWTALRIRPDVLQAYLPLTNFMGAVAGCLARVPLVITCRRGLGTHQDRHKWWRGCDRIANYLSHVVTANSRAVAEDTIARDGISASKLVTIRNGLDLSSFEATRARDDVRRELDLAHDEIGLVCVANLIPYKGHADLFQALASARATMPPFKLFVVGRDDGTGHELSALAAELGIEERVVFSGSRTDVGTILRAMDVFVLASHEEGSSNAVLEAMASGLPVIATDVGGNREALKEGLFGLIVPPRDTAALAGALCSMVSELDDWRGKAAEAAKCVRDEYSIQRLVKNYITVYQR